MQTLLSIVHITACLFLVLFVLVQSGKGAEISASLGGSSQTVFGSSGGANFFTRATAVLATLFMVSSIGLTLLKGHGRRSIFEGHIPSAPAGEQKPAVPAPAAATVPATTPAAAAPAAPANTGK